MVLAEVIGFVAGGIGLTQSIPQSLRLRRLGHGRGVSKVTWILNFILNSTWIGYGIHTKSAAVTLTNSFGLFMTSSIVLVLLEPNLRPKLWLPLLGLLIIYIVTLLPAQFTSALVIILTLSRVPQVLESYKNLNDPQTTAVSLHSLAISTSSLICWELFAILEKRVVVMSTTTIALTLTLSIMILEIKGKRKRQIA